MLQPCSPACFVNVRTTTSAADVPLARCSRGANSARAAGTTLSTRSIASALQTAAGGGVSMLARASLLAKRSHVLPFTVYSHHHQQHHTGCLHCAPTLDVSHALVSSNTVNEFIRQNRTFRKSPSVFYLYIYIYLFYFFLSRSPSPSTVAVAYQYVSAGSWSLLFLFVFRKHGRPCDTT